MTESFIIFFALRIQHVGLGAYVGHPRSEENHPESRFLLAHFMNPCT